MQSKSNLLNFFIKSNPFQPGREVFFMDETGEETTSKVSAIRITEQDGKLQLSYEVEADWMVESLHSSKVFDTKKELRK